MLHILRGKHIYILYYIILYYIILYYIIYIFGAHQEFLQCLLEDGNDGHFSITKHGGCFGVTPFTGAGEIRQGRP